MTDSNDGPPGTGGGGDDEAVDAGKDLDELQPVLTSLRPAQHRGRETDAVADAAGNDRDDSERSCSDASAADPDGLDEPAPVSTSLRSAQSRASDADGAGDGDDMDASDVDGSGDD